ncbi:MAG: orotidine-5'-phosphate decarboxylase [Pseudomonadota bacterium]
MVSKMGEDRLRAAREKVIFPLDVPGRREAEALIRELRGEVGLFKVGLELFVKEGHPLLGFLLQEFAPIRIFLDLKFHDIRRTVVEAMHSALQWCPRFVTIHSSVGYASLKAATDAAPEHTGILAITVLTNLNGEDLEGLGFRREYMIDPGSLVLLRAGLAQRAGCAGIVCSGQEVRRVKQEYPDLLVVTPGIRPGWAGVANDDQKRIATPRDAILAGADYLVVGRPIREHSSPRQAARLVAEEVAQALDEKK